MKKIDKMAFNAITRAFWFSTIILISTFAILLIFILSAMGFVFAEKILMNLGVGSDQALFTFLGFFGISAVLCVALHLGREFLKNLQKL